MRDTQPGIADAWVELEALEKAREHVADLEQPEVLALEGIADYILAFPEKEAEVRARVGAE